MRLYHDFELLYKSNGGDFCDMKYARSLLSNQTGRVAVVFKKKGDDNLIGFATEEHFFDYSEDSSWR
jgi:hypothetical protein